MTNTLTRKTFKKERERGVIQQGKDFEAPTAYIII